MMHILLFLFLLLFQSYAESSTHFLYVRHGEVPGNDPHSNTYLYTGCTTNDALTEKGQAQATLCAEFIAAMQNNKIVAIYSSDLTRATQTAAAIAKKLDLPLHTRSDLREIYWGCADGQLVQKMTEEWGMLEKQIKQTYPDRKTRWDHLPVFTDAETFNALLHRSTAALKEIASKHPDQTVIVVGHGRVLKTLIADTLDSEENIPYPPNCGIAEFTFSPEEGLQFIKIF